MFASLSLGFLPISYIITYDSTGSYVVKSIDSVNLYLAKNDRACYNIYAVSCNLIVQEINLRIHEVIYG